MKEKSVPEAAIVLAGGKGTRLLPITDTIPKPLVMINKKPTIAHIVDELIRNGIHMITLSVGYKADKIVSYFENRGDLDAEISFVVEKEALGTGGAIKLCMEKAHRGHSEDVFVLNGDDLFRMDISKMYSAHKASGANGTLALRRITDVAGFGVVVMEGSKIVRFVEKPDPEAAPSNLINIGKYIFGMKILGLLPKEKAFSIEKDFFMKSVPESNLHGYVTDAAWHPTDDMDRLERARKSWEA